MSFDLKIQNGDLVIKTGDFQTVEGIEKLIQDILKISITPIGSNVWFPWYGSPIGKTLIGNSFDTKFVAGMASSQLRTSIENLVSLQKFQAQSSQVINPGEHISAIENINIQRNNVDPRFWSVFISVLSKAFTRVNVDFNVSL